MHRLFATAKVLVHCDTYGPGVEKRDGEDVAILKLTLRVQPFDAKLATSLDEGIGGDSNVRSTVFAHTAEPKPHFTRHDCKPALDALQLLTIFETSDTPTSRVAIDQVQIHGLCVRVPKNADDLALVIKASFGPVSAAELEYVHGWVRGQRAVTFTESQTALDFDEDGEDEDDIGDLLGQEAQ
jgi:hypothetical protein